MNEELVIHPQTRAQLDDFIKQPSHALLLVAPSGMGKLSIAKSLTAQLLGIKTAHLANYPYFLLVSPQGNSISIDEVRQLQQHLRLKTLGQTGGLRRVIIIEAAERLTVEAQNALLKTLEEPPADTLVILCAANRQALLPTVLSRMQELTIKTPARTALETYFSAAYRKPAIEQAYRISGGLPGLMTALLEQPNDHPLAHGIETAKHWLGAPTFERLQLVDQLVKDKEQLATVLDGLERISQAGLELAAGRNQDQALRRWQHILKLTVDSQAALQQNSNPKLLLTHLMLEL